MGQAIRFEIRTHFSASQENRVTICQDLAPMAFLIPISFVLLSAIKEDKPYKPRLDRKIDSAAKRENRLRILLSDKYKSEYSSSRKEYSRGKAGYCLFQVRSILLIVFLTSLPSSLIKI